MSKPHTEVAPEGKWYFKHVEAEDNAVFLKMNDARYISKNNHMTERILDIKPHSNRSYDGYVQITFDTPTAASGKWITRFDLSMFDAEKSSFGERLAPLALTGKEFCSTLKAILKPSENSSSQREAVRPTRQNVTSPPTSDGHRKNKKKRVSTSSTRSTVETVDLPSPNKQKKAHPSDIDQRIDSHYCGHFHMNTDLLSDNCPESWLDRKIKPSRVQELASALEKTPTLAKTMQAWIAIADISKANLTSKELLKGCRIVVVGGRHRQQAYKKVRHISEVHKNELAKVWVHVYDNGLTEDEIRRLAAMHNLADVGSMSTPWLTRVHACREWLYKGADKNIKIDETPASTQNWKMDCQAMYVATGKDPNTLEPTLQAALLERSVYDEFQKVGELFRNGELKDQKKNKKSKSEHIPQSKLGMPLQGLADDTKLEVLRQVVRKDISVKEFQEKCQRIKKKQHVVNAFVKHAGEQNYDDLKRRFPLHTTEEKLAQFASSQITKKHIPQEVTAFFERAIQWENEKRSSSLNLHEERDGVYFYTRNESSAILLEGSFCSLPLEKIKTLINPRLFKGFSLVLAFLPKETTSSDLYMLLTSVHATNVDLLNNYNIIIIHEDDGTVKMCKDTFESRLTKHQDAYWVNTKRHKFQGHVMRNSIRHISIGHWAKDGNMTDAHCHFKDEESGSNAFCFDEEEEGRLPKALSSHIISHFSFEGQWVLDLTQSKDFGIVAAISSERNCVSLMSVNDLRCTAEAASNSVHQDYEDEKSDSASGVDE